MNFILYIHRLLLITLLLLVGSCNGCRNFQQPSTQLGSFTPADTTIKENKPEIPVKNHGIPSGRNRCYMNATLQMLASFYRETIASKTGPLAQAGHNLIKTITNQDPVASDEVRKKAQAFYEALEKSTSEGGIGWMHKDTKQEDAYELLTKIFDQLDMPRAQVELKYIHPTTGAEKAILPDEFTIRSLAMPIDQKGKQQGWKTIEDLINHELAPELVDDDYKWNETDRISTKNVKKVKTFKYLNNLYGKTFVIALNRFQYNADGSSSKIEAPVDNPFEILIKKEQTVDNTQDIHYKLVGFIHHSGIITGGHYVAFAKLEGKWILYDDGSVSEVTDAQAEANARKAYVFFYQPIQ